MSATFIYIFALEKKEHADITKQAGDYDKINLADYNLSENDLTLAKSIMQDKPYKWIANRLNVSESTVKREIHVLYKKFGVSRKKEFCDLLIAHNFEFSSEI
ncbi:hypothetical protein FACS1894102_6920 [Spirochaetia bacterium]|nr:hypothetical protein FACS1894102_6920 [Spirochaetia bacterium]